MIPNEMLQDWILVEPIVPEGPLFIPEASVGNLDSVAHKVVMVSDEADLKINPGDIIVLEGLTQTYFKYKGKTYHVARAKNVICILEKEE